MVLLEEDSVTDMHHLVHAWRMLSAMMKLTTTSRNVHAMGASWKKEACVGKEDESLLIARKGQSMRAVAYGAELGLTWKRETEMETFWDFWEGLEWGNTTSARGSRKGGFELCAHTFRMLQPTST